MTRTNIIDHNDLFIKEGGPQSNSHFRCEELLLELFRQLRHLPSLTQLYS